MLARRSADDLDDGAALAQSASGLAPQLAAMAVEGERAGRLPDAAVRLLEDSGLLRALTPRSRGGHQAPMGEVVGVLAELARGCGSTSWVSAIYLGGVYALCSFPDQAQEEFFAASENPKAFGAINAQGHAEPCDGGYTLSGKWGFCSGQHHADWGSLAVTTVTADGGPDRALVLIPRAECRVVDEWQVSGLAATGSNTVVVEDAFIPAHRMLRFSDLAAGRCPSSLRSDDPYYTLPFVQLFGAIASGVPLGLAREAVELMRNRIGRRAITGSQYSRQSDAAITHLQMADVTMRLDQAQFHSDRALATTFSIAADPHVDVATRLRVRADVAWAIRLSKEVVDTVQSASGASSIRLDDPLQRIVRDVQAISLHASYLFNTNVELYGRVLCGLDPAVPVA